MEKTLKINLASGRQYLKGYINVDDGSMNPKRKLDVKADIFKYNDISKNKVDEILLSHFMMYVTPKDALRLFKRWYGWLKPNSELIIETSDARSIAMMILVDDENIGQMFGYGATAGHKWSYTPEALKKLLRQAGFKITCVSRGGSHGRLFRDFTVIATK